MQRLTNVAALTVASVVLAAALVGCGGGDDDEGSTDEPASGDKPASNGIADELPAVIADRALDANRTLNDASYEGKLSLHLPIGSRALKATLSAVGDDCAVKVWSEDFGSLSIRLVGDAAYLKGTEEAWSDIVGAPASMVDLIGARWVKGDLPGEVVATCDRVRAGWPTLDVESCLQGGDGEVAGVPTVVVRCRDAGIEQRLHVATTGSPLVLRIQGGTWSGPFDMALVDSNQGIEVTAPPKRDVIDSSAFE